MIWDVSDALSRYIVGYPPIACIRDPTALLESLDGVMGAEVAIRPEWRLTH